MGNGSASESQHVFAELLIQQGLAGREKVEECLRDIDRMRRQNQSDVPTLGKLLVMRGYLTQSVYEATIRIKQDVRAPMAPPAAAENLPQEVRESLKDPKNDLGEFVLLKLLGKGGMGEVYQAWERKLARIVALKFIRGHNRDDVTRFEREAQIVGRLNHPNIAPVYGLGQHYGDPFIVMQFVDGMTLDRAELDLRGRLKAIRDAAGALDHAHRQGVIHRDVKPGNIMLAGGQVFVMDFGLARQTKVESSISQSGMIVGTPGFMSPEQARGQAKLVDGRTDVYGLGATLYQLVTGQPPFQVGPDDDVMMLLRRVAEEEPLPVRKLNAGLPWEVETIILKAMDKERDRRYATAMTMAEDIQRYLDGEVITAKRASFTYRIRKNLAKRKAVVIASAIGLFLALGVGGWFGIQLIAEQKAREREVAAERARAEEREKALKELGTRWAQVILAREGFKNAVNDPSRVRKRIEDAVEKVSAYINQHPDHPQGYYVRARGWIYLNETLKAEQDLLKAVELEPRFAPGFALLGRVKLEQYTEIIMGPELGAGDRHGRGATYVAKAEEYLAKGWAQGEDRLSVEKWGLVRTREDAVTEIIVRALRARYVTDEPLKAWEIMRDAYRQEPEAEYSYQLANLMTNHTEAIPFYTRALEHMPLYAEAFLGRARRKELLADHDGAIEDDTQALRINPNLHGAYHHRGIARMTRGDLKEALGDFNKAIELNPDYGDAISNRALVRTEMGDPDGAIADLLRALELEPGNAGVYVNLANARWVKGDAAGAMADIDKAIKLDPKLAPAYGARAFFRTAQKDLKGALEDYAKTLELNPQQFEAWFNRANINSAQGRIDAALADYAKALEINPKLVPAYVNRGSLLMDQGKLEEAMTDFDKAVEFGPRTPHAWANRGACREALAAKQKDRDRERELLGEAIKDLEQCLKIAPEDSPLRDFARQSVKRIQKKIK